ncbi:MAG: glycosyltransferase [Candidatus Hydrogenedentes bacterium]|nr:glycosyltransferase [Candidatus Hydrogenedentota bacterium]
MPRQLDNGNFDRSQAAKGVLLKILSHGLPFFCDYEILRQYRGAHEIRTLSALPGADYRLRPEVDTIEDLLHRIAPEFSPDLILVWTPENDPPPLGIERSPVRTACLAGDWNLFYNAQRINLGRYDVVLADKRGVDILRSDTVQPAYVFPLYAHNTRLHVYKEWERDIDILYVGNLNLSHRAERGRWLQRLTVLSRQYKVVITNNAWGRDYTDLLCRAKIVFNHSVRGEVNLRVFESMACGALALLEATNVEVHELFTDGDDIVLYDDANFEERIRHYLDHPEALQPIADRARSRVQAFSGEARLDALVDFINGQPDSGRPFLQLPEQERLLQDHLMFAVSQRTEYWAAERRLGELLRERYPDEPRALSAYGHSVLFWRDKPQPAERSGEVLQSLRKAVKLAPDSAVHALNAATGAQYYGQAPLAKLFLQLAIRCTSAEPADYLWGSWTNPHWTGWLRACAEKRQSLASLHAEAHRRLADLLLQEGSEKEALDHLNTAHALDPQNVHLAVKHADLLWKHGQRGASIQLMTDALPGMALIAGFRTNLAARCRELGQAQRAEDLSAEAADIERALRLADGRPTPPRSHARTAEPAAQPVVEVQEARLRTQAAENSDLIPLMLFLGTLGRREEVAQLRASRPLERALQAVLTEGEAETRELLAQFHGAAPLHYHLLLKRCLKRGVLDDAFTVCRAAAATHPRDTTCWNLLARFLSRIGDARVQEVVGMSLAISPQQYDIAQLQHARFEGELFLESAPRHIPLSFYLPVFNVARYIGDTLARVLDQCYPIHELFIVNDGSTDDSVDIARRYPVRILHHDENRGLAAARNTALVEATGEWLMSVDTDAAPARDYLLHMVLEMESADPKIAALGGMLLEEYQDTPADQWRAHMMRQHHGDLRLQPPPFVYGATMCVRRPLALAAGGFAEDHRTNGEDAELCKALVAAGYTFVYTPLAQAYHQRRDDLQSALRTWWGWYYWVKVEANAYTSIAGLFDAQRHTLAIAGEALNAYLAEGRQELWYIGFLHPFHDAFMDFRQAVKTGQLLPGEARSLQDALLATVAMLDQKYGGNLLAQVRRDLAPLLAGSAASAPLSDGFRRELDRYLTPLSTMIESIPAEFYAALCEGFRIARSQ